MSELIKNRGVVFRRSVQIEVGILELAMRFSIK